MKKKIKLRDMTDEQFIRWKRDECGNSVCQKCPFRFVPCDSTDAYSFSKHKDMYSDKFLDQEIEIEVPDILTPEEKEYLEAVIKPFRSWVKSIGKIHCELDDERLVIAINHYPAITIPTTNYLRFEGITQDDSFTLEELGL